MPRVPRVTEDPYDDDTVVETVEPTEAPPMAETTDRLAFYCPGCGRQYTYQRECTGRPEAPHQPIEVVSTDELSGDPANLTPAPTSE